MELAKKHAEQLRQKAESRLDRIVPSFVQPLPGESLLHELMHELRISQIELEMQNEAMRQSQIELEISRDRYVDFYDFALVGYITLSQESMIDDINLSGAKMLGVAHKIPTPRRFASFVSSADRDRWHHHFMSVLKSDYKGHCELALQKCDGTLFNALLICQRLKKPDKDMLVRIVMADLSEVTPVEAENNERQF